MKKNKLTYFERNALLSVNNLADGHAHQGQSASHIHLLSRLPELYREAEKQNQQFLENEFEEKFFNIAGQKSYNCFNPPQYHHACSISIEVVANFLRLENKSVSLLHPTFDNLADILKRHKVSLSPLTEAELLLIANGEHSVESEVIFIVLPNNPTGFELSQEQFTGLVRYCKKNNKILIMDCSFRFYSSLRKWDQYAILFNEGVDFITLEDTGKTWPTLDLKLGILLSSDTLYNKLRDITDDFVLNVSPFIFKLLTEYLRLENIDQDLSCNIAVAKNRKYLIEQSQNSCLKVSQPSESMLSVAWVELPNSWSGLELCAELEKHNVFVLPGGPFYWNDYEMGNRYIRIALCRPVDIFKKSTTQLFKLIQRYSKNHKS